MSKTILAVDDERNIVRLVQVNLERHGYNVVTACNGQEGLDKIAVQRPDMVIVDVMMPVMDGFEMLRILRKSPETRYLPVIMLTAKAMDNDVFEGYRSGVDCYLTKPFNPNELISFVQRIFKAQNEPGENRYHIG